MKAIILVAALLFPITLSTLSYQAPTQKDKVVQYLSKTYKKPYSYVSSVYDHAKGDLLVLSLAATESSLNATAKSKKGAKGLLQITKQSGKQPKNPYSVSDNIKAGSEHLYSYVDRFGLEAGVMVYNVGPKNYHKGKRAYQYAKKVLSLHEKLLTLG